MENVYKLCEQLHEKIDPRKNAFRPEMTYTNKTISKIYKQHVPKNTLLNKKKEWKN